MNVIMELTGQALAGMFPNSARGVKGNHSGLVEFRVEIDHDDMDEAKKGEGLIREWGSELVAWQALQVISRHNAATRFDDGLCDRAKRAFGMGLWKDGLKYITAYRDQLEKRCGDEGRKIIGKLIKETRFSMKARLSGWVLAGKTEGAWYHGGAKAELSAPVMDGTRPIIAPAFGCHVCSGMPTLKLAVDDALGHAIGMIAPDLEARYRGTPPLSEVLAMIRKDLEKAGMVA